ncbi:YitT family protein [Fictibacillus fluitans]|uniref:YitT family protein n=1 Tax=Fictibacillus fluitans TaxID=3058422 RepID=A0ABT8I3P9_9BACL|nr:YitT family protein [Fictibacillus sp. NE201]MDN4527670.1 YitT family protein [Fictibacillus sp. NE201]
MLAKMTAVFIGSFLMGIGINMFILPFHLLDGGIIGIGLLVKYIWGFKVGMTIILLSIPIYFLAWKFDRRYFLNSLHGMLISSFVIDLLVPLNGFLHFPEMESAVAGGLLIGTGIGIMLRYETSTGGTDLLALFIARRSPLNVGIIIFFIDASVILAGLYFMGEGMFFYSMVTILSVAFATSSLTLIRSVSIFLSPR